MENAETSKPIVVGLTGGIASGKSTMTLRLVGLGFKVFDYDAMISRAYDEDDIAAELREHFRVINDTVRGDPLKTIVSSIMWSQPTEQDRLDLQMYLWKLVGGRVDRFYDEWYAENINEPVVFLDVPMLFQSQYSLKCDYTVGIVAPIKIRIERALNRSSKHNRYELEAIAKAQLSDEELTVLCNTVISSDTDSVEEFQQRVDSFIKERSWEDNG